MSLNSYRLNGAILLIIVALSACQWEPEVPVAAPPKPVAANPKVPLRLIVSPFREGMEKVFPTISGALSKKLGVEVQFEKAESYETAIESLVSGRADLCFLPPLSFIRARKRSPGLALVVSEEIRATLHDRAVIAVQTSSTIRSVKELPGRRFGLVSKSSASGYVFPWVYLKRNGLDPKVVLSDAQVTFAHDHDSALALLLEGKVEVAATYDWAVTEPSGRLKKGVRIIAWSEPLPHSVIAARSGFLSAEIEGIKQAFLSLSRDRGASQEVLDALELLGVSGFARLDEHALLSLYRLESEFTR